MCGWEQGEWAGSQTGTERALSLSKCISEGFGLIAALPARVGHTHQTRQSRLSASVHWGEAGETDGGRPFVAAQNRGYDPASYRLEWADVAEWQTLQT